jgi:biopolymer transport protein ExbB
VGQIPPTTGAGGAIPPAADSIRIDSVWDFVVKGGPVMIPIGLASIVALTIIVERLINLRRRNLIPSDFVQNIKKRLRDPAGDRTDALEYCASSPSTIAEVFAVGIKRMGEPIELLERHIQEAGQRAIMKLRKNLRSLSVIASISTLLGLLGTIFGMISCFQTVAASAEALGKTELLAAGIYEAMITTAAGLVVAIPVLVAYHALSARVEGLVGEVDQLAVEFVETYGISPVEPPVQKTVARVASHIGLEPVLSNEDGDGREPKASSKEQWHVPVSVGTT